MKIFYDVISRRLYTEKEVFEMYLDYLREGFEKDGLKGERNRKSFLDFFENMQYVYEVSNSDQFLSSGPDGMISFDAATFMLRSEWDTLKQYISGLKTALSFGELSDIMGLSLEVWLDENDYHEVVNAKEFWEQHHKEGSE